MGLRYYDKVSTTYGTDRWGCIVPVSKTVEHGDRLEDLGDRFERAWPAIVAVLGSIGGLSWLGLAVSIVLRMFGAI